MKSPLIAALALSTLSACNGSMPPCVGCVPPPPIPSNLMAECPELPLLQGGSFPEVSGHLAMVGLMYSNCAAKHNLLTRVLRNREKKEEK